MPVQHFNTGTLLSRAEIPRPLRGRGTRCAATFVLAALAAGSAVAQTNYPVKPIRFVIGTQVGAGSELMARLIGQPLQQAWGQPYVVEPHPGAGGNIAAELVAKSAPDGYTLYVCFGSHTINPSLFARVGYRPVDDFAPVMLIAKQYNALAVHPSVPAKSVKELVALAKARPGRMSYASAGTGSPGHLGMELFRQTAGFDSLHVPYKGAAPAQIDLLGGHVDMMFVVLRTILPFHHTGKARLVGVTSPQRSALVPDVPTIEESGWKGIEVLTWHGLLAPAGTPATIVNRINAEARKALLAPAHKDRYTRDGIDIVASDPAEFEAYMRADVARWRTVIQTAKIRPD